MRYIVSFVILLLTVSITSCVGKPDKGIYDAIEAGDHAKLEALLKKTSVRKLNRTMGNHVFRTLAQADNPTPLQHACSYGRFEMVRMLVEAGAEPNGYAIMVAGGRDRFLIRKCLVDAGGNCIGSRYLEECLRMLTEEMEDEALCEEQLDVFRAIYRINEEQLDVPMVEAEPYLLEKATYGSGFPVVKFLLEEGYPVNPEPDEETGHVKNGCTPLGNAARGGRAQIVEYLLSQGADAHLRNYKNMTALEYLMDRRERLGNRMDDDDRIIEMLKKAEAEG